MYKNSFASLQLNPHKNILNATVKNKLRHDFDLCRSVKNIPQQDQDGTAFDSDPARKLSANMYDTYHCCV